jgi:hypothetical protein
MAVNADNSHAYVIKNLEDVWRKEQDERCTLWDAYRAKITKAREDAELRREVVVATLDENTQIVRERSRFPIPDFLPDSGPSAYCDILIISKYARSCIDKGIYIPLAHFTQDQLAKNVEKFKSLHHSDDEVEIFLDDGLVLRQTKHSQPINPRPDSDLSFSEIMFAKQIWLQAMERSGTYSAVHITAWFKLFSNLDTSALPVYPEHGDRVFTTYVDKICRLWYDDFQRKDETLDVSVVNESLIDRTLTNLSRESLVSAQPRIFWCTLTVPFFALLACFCTAFQLT